MSKGSSFYQPDNMWALVDEATSLAQEQGTQFQLPEETSRIENIGENTAACKCYIHL